MEQLEVYTHLPNCQANARKLLELLDWGNDVQVANEKDTLSLVYKTQIGTMTIEVEENSEWVYISTPSLRCSFMNNVAAAAYMTHLLEAVSKLQ